MDTTVQITPETLAALLDVLNVQLSYKQTAEQQAYCHGLRNMLEMVLTDRYRKPGCIARVQRQGYHEYIFTEAPDANSPTF